MDVTITMLNDSETKKKDYGQEKDGKECRESGGSDESRLSVYTLQIAGDNGIQHYGAMYGGVSADS